MLNWPYVHWLKVFSLLVASINTVSGFEFRMNSWKWKEELLPWNSMCMNFHLAYKFKSYTPFTSWLSRENFPSRLWLSLKNGNYKCHSWYSEFFKTFHIIQKTNSFPYLLLFSLPPRIHSIHWWCCANYWLMILRVDCPEYRTGCSKYATYSLHRWIVPRSNALLMVGKFCKYILWIIIT